MRRLPALWLISLWLVLAGCPPRPPDVPPADRFQRPADLLAAVRERGKAVTSVRATGTIDMRKGSKRIKAHMLLVVRRPARLRFETESFFDQPLSILVTDGMDFSLWDMDQGRFLIGAATAVNISQVIPIPMDGPDVTGILFGDAPLIAYAEARLEWQDGYYDLTLENSRERQEIRFHPVRLRPERVRCYLENELLYDLKYEDWHEKPGDRFVPRKLRFEMQSEKIRLIMKIREAEVDAELADDLFVIEPPEGLPVERLDP